jgi:hypothetical protein
MMAEAETGSLGEITYLSSFVVSRSSFVGERWRGGRLMIRGSPMPRAEAAGLR